VLWTQGSAGPTVSRAQGRHGVNDVAGSGRTTMLRAPRWHGVNGITGSGWRKVNDIAGSGTAWGRRRHDDGIVGSGMMFAGSMALPTHGQGRWRCVRRTRPGSVMMALGL
jgi:hypothetical protein